MDCGFNKTKPGGLFSKVTREGVSAFSGRWIKDRWLRLDLGREKEKGAGRNSVSGDEAPLPAARRSPARAELGPRATVRRTEGTRGERG